MKLRSFEESLAEGRRWQIAAAGWLRRKDFNVLDLGGLGNDKAPRPLMLRLLTPRGDFVIRLEAGKGPRLLTPRGAFVLPDLLAFGVGKPTMWVECKKKEKADWHWKTQTYVTGIDRWHYAQYRHIQRETGLPVYLLFLHVLEREIRGEELSWLEANVHHFGDPRRKMHPSGMVFWEYAALRLYGSLDELRLDEREMSHGAA